MKLEGKQIGVFTALIIAGIMLILPGTDKNKYSFKPDVLAKAILENEDQLSPAELSDWIIQGRNDYQLIDIRDAKIYENGHIKGAQNIPLNDLLQKKTIERELSRDKLIVIYSNGNSHAHQAWLVLKAARVDSVVLEGGYNNWNKMILNPKLPAEPTDDEILRYKKDKSVAEYYGGGSTVSEESSGSSQPAKKVIRKKKKSKLEGC